MRSYNDNSNINFGKRVDEDEEELVPYFISALSVEHLFSEMQRCACEEKYEEAIIYRDELVRRKILTFKK